MASPGGSAAVTDPGPTAAVPMDEPAAHEPAPIPDGPAPKPDVRDTPAASAEKTPQTGPEASRLALKSMAARDVVSEGDVVEAAGAGERDGIVGRLAGGLVRSATVLLGTVPERVGALIEESVENLADGLKQAAKGVWGGPGSPADSAPPASFPAPPPAPVSPGCSSGNSLTSGQSGSCGGAAEKLFHQFAVLAPFSAVLPRVDGEVSWHSREPLVPSSAPRPPNERPG
ncbi:hypothetical protein [Rubrobacter tropicus]|uniref:hypothetical protein n=1 Tax=Rubrobacter tropicus TaxID=2653851 RepID=UPI00140816FF|nr:hypothetical protein [Rubrobacter tropicus]